MTDYLQIKIDRESYEVALAILRKEFAFMRNLTCLHAKYAQLERTLSAFYAAPLINETSKTQRLKIMDLKHIKIGEKYKLELLCIHNAEKVIIFETPTGALLPFRESDLECVSPVEELEPYSVETGGYNRFRIKKGNLEYSYFPFGEHCVLSMDEAKAAAEAERDRLNAEPRKEKE